MEGILAFALTLLVAVLLSGLAHRSVLSAAVLFLAAGFLFGKSGIGLVRIEPGDAFVARLIEVTLFAALYTDGMLVGVQDLISAWRLPGRALLLGMPLTLAAMAALAHWLVGLSWGESLLVGAVLSPTDPVFASAIVGREDVPQPLRRLLGIESGLNDGLALPIVLILLATLSSGQVELVNLLGEVALGIVIGIVVPWIAIGLQNSRFLSAADIFEPLMAFAIGLLVFALASLAHGNLFLAAYTAGIAVATFSARVRDAFRQFGELVAELLKLGAILAFGALLSVQFFAEIPIGSYLFAVLVLIVARPFGLGLALIGSGLDLRERIVAAWFGPRGFASVLYGLVVLQSAVARANFLFHLIAIAIVGSMVAHSSTDVLVANWFKNSAGQPRTRGQAQDQRQSGTVKAE